MQEPVLNNKMKIGTGDLNNLNQDTAYNRFAGSIEKQPSIPNLPSKETLAYARKISEQLNLENTNGENFQTKLGDDQVLTLSNNIKDIRRHYSNYSSIGSGNLASESGTSHVRYETESELEHFHMRDAFYQLDNEYDSNIGTSEMTVPPPRNKNRPKSRICIQRETGSLNTNIQEPPSIRIQYVDDSEVKADERYGNTTVIDNNYTYKHVAQRNDQGQDQGDEEGKEINDYLQRPVPEEPLKADDLSDNVKNSLKTRDIKDRGSNIGSHCDTDDSTNIGKTLSSQQQRNINTLSQLISIANTSTVGVEFDRLAIPNEERILLEQLIDTLSRLAADIFLDPSRRTEILKRLDSTTRVLEGF